MHNRSASLIALMMGTSWLAACSADGTLNLGGLQTSSVEPSPAVQAPKLDPTCVALVARIEALRKDGITERVEKASVGKTTNVSIKRASLAQVAELDKANAEFQARCAPAGLRPIQAQYAPPAASPPQAVVSPRAGAAAPAPVVPPIVTQKSQ